MVRRRGGDGSGGRVGRVGGGRRGEGERWESISGEKALLVTISDWWKKQRSADPISINQDVFNTYKV